MTLSASTVYPGQPVDASWTTNRPSGCTGVTSALTGPSAWVSGGVGGSATVTPPNLGVNTYTVTVFYPGGHQDVVSASVTVQPLPGMQVARLPSDLAFGGPDAVKPDFCVTRGPMSA